MGVDVRLYGENCRNLNQKDLDKVNNYIQTDDGWERFEIEIVNGKEYIYYKTMYRLYHEGYERGPWWIITGIINLLRQLSGGKIVYVGDFYCDEETVNMPEFTRAEQNRIDRLYVDSQRSNYENPNRY